ncbi:helicase-exonuclease AddAB subunit AddA [uncultured Selenomonas sp.]|uniref:helicase-exonuclease AddAB subunit AddA n=1 Tax=uncultured Selenomonas sp. TaxID=159275 RepID=UPI0025EACD2D|nr:helicase-exonuclease AddAB subunit AddA [uncultured Selenomonas sp.]
MGWTPDQEDAFTIRDKNLLVAAAAGSGKTAVLVERIVREVLSGACNVDELLVMTFTEAAAREMRQRVEARLEQELERAAQAQDAKTPDDGAPRLTPRDIERQLVLLSGSSISTVHHFCRQILQRHFESIDYDPASSIGNTQELALLRQDALEQLFEKEYDEGTEAFLRFTDHYGDDRGDQAVYSLIERVSTFSLAQPFPAAWLKKQAATFDLPLTARLEDTPWQETVWKAIRRKLRALEALEANLVQDVDAEGDTKFSECFHSDLAEIHRLQSVLAEGDWDAARQAFASVKFARRAGGKDMDPETKDALGKRRDDIKKKLQKLGATYFEETEEDILHDLRSVASDMKELVRLTLAFQAAFQQAKKEKRIVDFNDLEHFALDVLMDREAFEADGSIVPSDVARALQKKYYEVMVDEYQDTNDVQETIVSLVRKADHPNLFVVGDVKQSIYRFRLAEPHLFLEKSRLYPKEPETSQIIHLSKNFRSRPGVLAAINYIFEQVMVESTMEIGYGPEEALYPNEDGYPACDAPTLDGPAELAVLLKDSGDAATDDDGAVDDGDGGDKDDILAPDERSGLEREAQYVADRIHAFFQAGTQVYHKDDGTYHPLAYRDIVILMRSVKGGKAETVRKCLQDNGIPAYASSDASYFEAPEVRLMLAFLAVLDNARQDIPLAAVLLSPIGGFSFGELSAMRIAARDCDLFDALKTAAAPERKLAPAIQQKAGEFLAQLTRWRDLARELGVPELVWLLYRETGYYDYVGGLPGGLLKQANLRLLASRAAAYEQTNFRGLTRFLQFVKRMRAQNTDLASARTLGESEDVVRVLSIHGSKGLEFPLVFVLGIGTQFNTKDFSQSDLLLHKDLGFGPFAIDEPISARFATFARKAVTEKLMEELKAEELRLLYVALTRARERLILVGSSGRRSTFVKNIERWGQEVPRTTVTFDENTPLTAMHLLDWVIMALLHHSAGAPLRALAGLSTDVPALPDGHEPPAWAVHLVDAPKAAADDGKEMDEVLAAVQKREPLEASSQKEAVEHLLTWTYPSHDIEAVPSKLSVSELKRRFAAEEAEEAGTPLFLAQENAIWKRPRFIQETTRRTGAEYGSLMHSVLQHADLMGDLTPTGLRAQLQAMVEKELFTPDEAKAIRIETIAAFYASPIGARLLRAAKVWRELPFSRLIPAQLYRKTAEGGETMLIQGVIDLLFEEADGTLVLVDYKTDSDTSPAKLHANYDKQIGLYRDAVKEILGRTVDESLLYLLHDGTTLAM